jgi:hypothetical protein
VRPGLGFTEELRGRTTRSGLTAEVAFEVVSSLAGEEAAEDAVGGQTRAHIRTRSGVRECTPSWKEVRNLRPLLVNWGGVVYSRLYSLFLNDRVSWMFRNRTGATTPSNPTG